jgi:protocatechuate 3,4-dioxygenase beta subunit
MAGQQLSGVDFPLTPGAVISGRVLDNANRPLANVRISVLGAGFRHGRPMWWTQTTIRTNDNGEYRIPDLAPGKWFLEARLPMLSVQRPKDRRPASGTAKGKPLVMFYPGVPQIAAAEALFLTSGEERDLQDIRVPAVDTSCVSADLPANGPAKAHVSLVAHTPGWRTMVGSGLAAGPGVIEICGVPWGAYHLQLTASGESGQALGFNQTSFEVGGKDVHLGVLSPDPPLTVPGKILVIEDSGRQKLALDRIQVGMEAYDRLFGYAGENAGAQVQPGGEFILPKLLNDLYWRVAVMGLPDGYYVKSALMAGRDPRREPMPAGSGELLVTLASDGATIRGRVVDSKDEPVPDALVVLAPSSMPSAGSPDLIATQLADQAGGFEFRTVAPGDYQLIALSRFALGAGENPDFIRKYFTKETAVSVQPRQSKEATVIIADR